jgi:hypothetical protein
MYCLQNKFWNGDENKYFPFDSFELYMNHNQRNKNSFVQLSLECALFLKSAI